MRIISIFQSCFYLLELFREDTGKAGYANTARPQHDEQRKPLCVGSLRGTQFQIFFGRGNVLWLICRCLGLAGAIFVLNI